MADFDPPFASVGGVNRSPTTGEQSGGFDCGAADLTLFNRLIGRVEAELKAIQDEGGITGSEGDDTTVLQAIQAMILAATGGGDVSNYVLFTQAQARLPIFPEVQTSDGKIAVTAPSTGTVRVPSGVTVLHRGIRTITTAETDLATTASKTYHLRCAISAGTLTFSLKDLADTGSYNPTSAAETNSAFDSTYDDMLVARVVTNSSNVATITNLVNKAQISFSENQYQTSGITAGGSPGFGYSRSMSHTYNFGRTPQHFSVTAVLGASGAGGTVGVEGVANYVRSVALTRYAMTYTIDTDFGGVVTGPYVESTISVMG